MLEPNIEVHKPNVRGSRPSDEEMAQWNAIIGMEEEPGEDLGAKALREDLEIQNELNDSDRSMIKAVQKYFVHRVGDRPEEHKQAARDIAESAGIRLEDLSFDLDDLVESVREEMEALDIEMSRIAQGLVRAEPRLLRSSRNLAFRIMVEFKKARAGNFEDIDEETKYSMADRVAKTVTLL